MSVAILAQAPPGCPQMFLFPPWISTLEHSAEFSTKISFSYFKIESSTTNCMLCIANCMHYTHKNMSSDAWSSYKVAFISRRWAYVRRPNWLRFSSYPCKSCRGFVWGAKRLQRAKCSLRTSRQTDYEDELSVSPPYRKTCI